MKNKRLIFSALMLLTMALTACDVGGGAEKTSKDPASTSASDDTSTPAPGHVHSWSTAWSHDAQYHWHACATCDEVNDKGEHVWDNGTIITPASAYKPGIKQYKCSVCGKIKKETISATGGNEPVGNFSFNDTELNTAQEIHTANQKAYLEFNKPYYEITSSDLNKFQATGASSLKKASWAPNAVTVNWNYTAPTGKTVTDYTFVYGQKADLGDAYQIPTNTTTNSISFTNAFLGDNYFKVIANLNDGTKEASQIKKFKVTDQAPRNLDVGNMPNCRDMGGRTTVAGGKIRQGLIYRTSGSKFDNSTPSNAAAKSVLMDLLRVRTEINVANSTTNNVNLSGVTVENAYMAYGAVPYSNLARNSARIRQVMEILADESNYPVFYHCRIGTDRTGITGIMINGLLGVPFNEAIQDYGFSNFSPIDNQRYPGKTPDNNGDDIKKYIDELLALPGANFQEQVYLALRMIGVPAAHLDRIIDIMTEGTKATIPATANIGQGGLLTGANRETSSDFKAPATYYALSNNQAASYKATFTAGKKDVIVYLGYEGNVTNSTKDKLADALSLKIDGAEQTIANTKNLWTAGFGATQQDNRIGYMFNILGNYDFTAGEHTVEVGVKNGEFNLATIAVVDRAA